LDLLEINFRLFWSSENSCMVAKAGTVFGEEMIGNADEISMMCVEINGMMCGETQISRFTYRNL